MDQSNYPQQPPPYNQPPQYPQNDEKQRHGCVTAWLVLMIIANAGLALVYLLANDTITRNLPENVPSAMIYLLGFIGIINVVFAVLLFQWKRWGFYGYVVSALATFLINLSIGVPATSSILGLVGIGILFGILQIKQNDVSAWDNME